MDLSRKDTVALLYKAALKFFRVHFNRVDSITFKEVHLNSSLRVDIFNLSYQEVVTVLELKSCRADFEADSKWRNYLDYCDKFYFMCPENIIKKEELPAKVGLIYVNFSDGGPYFNIVKNGERLKPTKLNNAWFKATFKKLAFRRFANVKNQLVSIDDETLF